jgi:hypothetical protein
MGTFENTVVIQRPPRVKAAVDENLDTLKQTLETGG